jgi:predicted negative regulator of RcsB-dependent stress response
VARGDLNAALAAYAEAMEPLVAQEEGNAQWQYDLGISNERIGNVQMAQGDLGAALKSYEARQAIISRLATSDPGNAGWQARSLGGL